MTPAENTGKAERARPLPGGPVSSTGLVSSSLFDGDTPSILTVSLADTVVPGPPILVVNDRPAPPPFSYLAGNLTFGSSTGNVFMDLAAGSAVAGVPEPGLAALLGCGVAAFAGRNRRSSTGPRTPRSG